MSYYGYYTVATKSGTSKMMTVIQGIEEEISEIMLLAGGLSGKELYMYQLTF